MSKILKGLALLGRKGAAMNRPKNIRQIYQDLRNILGPEIASHEVLTSSTAFVELFYKRENSTEVRVAAARPTFGNLP